MKSKTIKIDVAAICSIIHNCTGCTGESKRCCSSYDVTVGAKELQNIDGCIPSAARFCPDLKSHNGYENVFDRISSNLFSIDTTEEGVCVFAYFEDGKILCSLHTAAVKTAISFRKAKPLSCLLWPLALSEGAEKTLSIQNDAFDFTCNTRSSTDSFALCPSIATNLEWAFGIRFRDRIQEAADKKLPWISIPTDGSI